MEGAINGKLQDEYKEKKAKVEKFIAKIKDEIEASANDTRMVQSGTFKLRVNQNCKYEIPKIKYPVDPLKHVCVKAKYDGKLLAKSILDITKEAPTTREMALKHMGECKLIGEAAMFVKVDIYDVCLSGKFKAIYQEMFKKLVYRMERKGFKYNEKTKKFEKRKKLKEINVEYKAQEAKVNPQ